MKKGPSAEWNAEALITIHRILENELEATPYHLTSISNYRGWGALREYLETDQGKVKNKDRESLRNTIRNVLNERPEWGQEAMNLLIDHSVNSGHYTDPEIAKGMWKAVQRYAYGAQNILEPGAGMGVFPATVSKTWIGRGKFTLLEIDPVAVSGLRILYGDVDSVKHQDLRTFNETNNYDMAIGSVPYLFSQKGEKVFLRRGESHQLHDTIIHKVVDAIQPGGIAILLAPHDTLDKRDNYARRTLYEKADLLTAVRLPNNVFLRSAGRRMVSDVLVLRKRKAGEEPLDGGWVDTMKINLVTPDGNNMEYHRNAFFGKRVQSKLIIGQEKMYNRTVKQGVSKELEYTVEPTSGSKVAGAVSTTGGDVGRLLGTQLEIAPYEFAPSRKDLPDKTPNVEIKDEERQIGEIFVTDDGVFMEQTEDGPKPMEGQEIAPKADDDVAYSPFAGVRGATPGPSPVEATARKQKVKEPFVLYHGTFMGGDFRPNHPDKKRVLYGSRSRGIALEYALGLDFGIRRMDYIKSGEEGTQDHKVAKLTIKKGAIVKRIKSGVKSGFQEAHLNKEIRKAYKQGVQVLLFDWTHHTVHDNFGLVPGDEDRLEQHDVILDQNAIESFELEDVNEVAERVIAKFDSAKDIMEKLVEDQDIAYSPIVSDGMKKKLKGRKKPGEDADRMARIGRLIAVAREIAAIQTLGRGETLDEEKLAGLQEQGKKMLQEFWSRYGPLKYSYKATRKTRSGEEAEYTIYPNVPRRIQGVGVLIYARALESYNVETDEYNFSEWLTGRITIDPAIPDRVESVEEAVEVSIGSEWRIDGELMGELLGVEQEEALSQAKVKGLIFQDIETSEYLPFDEFISGDVTGRIQSFTDAGESLYSEELEILRNNLPERVALDSPEVELHLGVGWLNQETINEYLAQANLGDDTFFRVQWDPKANNWDLYKTNSTRARFSDTLSSDNPMTDFKLLDRLLNQYPIVMISKLADGTTIRNEVATRLAKEVGNRINDDFVAWVMAEKKEEVENLLNDSLNRIVPYKGHDPGENWRPPGLNAQLHMYRHQRRAVSRYMRKGNVGLIHATGAGKTLVMATIAMEAKRLGLNKKPMMVVPNRIRQQVADEVAFAYPGSAGNILMVEAVGSKAKAQEYLQKIINNDYDLIIMADHHLKWFSFSDEYQDRAYARKLQRLRAELVSAHNREDKRTVAGYQTLIDRLEREISAFNSSVARGNTTEVGFDHSGIDLLLIDEAHNFKNVDVQTPIYDAQSNASQMAEDLRDKLTYLEEEVSPGYNVVLSTATPITNQMSEAHTYLNALASKRLERMGNLNLFEVWRRNFAVIDDDPETNVVGDWKMRGRLSTWVNLKSLQNLLLDVSDVVNQEELDEYLDLPKKVHQNIAVSEDPRWPGIMEEARARLHAIETGAVKNSEDNHLMLLGDIRRAALDARLHGLKGESTTGSTISITADNIAKIYKETAEDTFEGSVRPGASQVVFVDFNNSTRNPEISITGLLVDKLVEKGVKKEEIYNFYGKGTMTGARMQEVFDNVNNGRYRVIIGNSGRMKEGVNIQRRLKALHHLTAPWRSTDIIQREGRIIRRGNPYKEALVFTYAVENSIDQFMYLMLIRKGSFINSMFREGIFEGDRMTDPTQDEFMQMQAMITGDSRFLDRAKLDREAEVLRREKNKERHARDEAQQIIDREEESGKQLEFELEKEKGTEQKVPETRGNKFKFALKERAGTTTFGTRESLAKSLTEDRGFLEGVKGIDGFHEGYRKEEGRFVDRDKSAEVEITHFRGELTIHATIGDTRLVSRKEMTIQGALAQKEGVEKTINAALIDIQNKMENIRTGERRRKLEQTKDAKAARIQRARETLAKEPTWTDEKERELQDKMEQAREITRSLERDAGVTHTYQAFTTQEAMTPEFVADKDIREELYAIIKGIFPHVQGVHFVDALYGSGPALAASLKAAGLPVTAFSEVAGATNRSKMTIQISLSEDIPNPYNTAYHEAYHLARMFMTPEEKAVLLSRFPSEEHEAVAFAERMTSGEPDSDSLLERIWAKLLELFRKVGNALRGRGYTSVDDIFNAVAVGQIGRRAARSVSMAKEQDELLLVPDGDDLAFAAKKEDYIGSINLDADSYLRENVATLRDVRKAHGLRGDQDRQDPARNARITVEELHKMVQSLSMRPEVLPLVRADKGHATALNQVLRAMLKQALIQTEALGMLYLSNPSPELRIAFIDAAKLTGEILWRHEGWRSEFGRGLGAFSRPIPDIDTMTLGQMQDWIDEYDRSGKLEYQVGPIIIPIIEIIESANEDIDFRTKDGKKLDPKDVLEFLKHLRADQIDEMNRLAEEYPHQFEQMIDAMLEAIRMQLADMDGQHLTEQIQKYNRLIWLYYQSILSNPRTTVVNLAGNSLMYAMNGMHEFISAFYGGVHRAVGGKNNFMTFGEARAGYRAIHKDIGAAVVAATDTIVSGHLEDRMIYHDYKGGVDIIEVFGRSRKTELAGPITPSRWLAAGDAFAKTMAGRIYIKQTVKRIAKRRKLSKQEEMEVMEEWVARPPAPMQIFARGFARYMTFTEPLTAIPDAIRRLRDSNTIFQFVGIMVIPFIRTLWHLARVGMRHVPVIGTYPFRRIRGHEGSRQKGNAMAEQTIGAFLSAAVYIAVSDGVMTGAGPSDDEERYVWLQTHQPYSILLPNLTWLRYDRYLEPLSIPLGILASIYERMGWGTTQGHNWAGNNALGDFIWKLSHSILDIAWSDRFGDSFEELTGALEDENKFERFIQRLAIKPYPGIMRFVNDFFGEQNRYQPAAARSIVGEYKRLFPWTQAKWPRKRNIFGDRVLRNPNPGPKDYDPEAIDRDNKLKFLHEMVQIGFEASPPGYKLRPSDFDVQQAEGDLAAAGYDPNALDGKQKIDFLRELKKMAMGVPETQPYIEPSDDGRTIELNEKEYEEWSKLRGEILYRMVSGVMTNPSYADLSKKDKRDMLNKAIRRAFSKNWTLVFIKSELDRGNPRLYQKFLANIRYTKPSITGRATPELIGRLFGP